MGRAFQAEKVAYRSMEGAVYHLGKELQREVKARDVVSVSSSS